MSVAPRSTFFRQSELLAGLPAAAVDRLAAASEPVRIRRRTALWSPGDPADRVFWVRSGVVKVSAEVDGGRELTLGFHAKGALLGEGAVLAEARRGNLAEAYEEVSAFVTVAAELDGLLDHHPLLARRLSTLIAARHRRLEARLGTLLFRSSHARLAALLLELADEFGVRDSRGVIVNLKLTHRELASLIGSTRETVSLALLEMRRLDLVEADGKRVVLLDPDRLAGLASELTTASARSP